MIEVKALKNFRDLKEKTIRKAGDTFAVSSARFDQINRTKHGELVEPIGSTKETEEELMKLYRDELVRKAEILGHEVTNETKAEIAKMILGD